MTAFSCIIYLKNWTMVSNFKFIPYFNILQNFVQNVGKPKWSSILSCDRYFAILFTFPFSYGKTKVVRKLVAMATCFTAVLSGDVHNISTVSMSKAVYWVVTVRLLEILRVRTVLAVQTI